MKDDKETKILKEKYLKETGDIFPSRPKKIYTNGSSFKNFNKKYTKDGDKWHQKCIEWNTRFNYWCLSEFGFNFER